MQLKNKIAIVTASTRGIGLETALVLAKNGATVYLAARNEKLANEIIKKHNDLKLKYIYFDIENENSIEEAIKQVYSLEKEINILVNNFGTSNPVNDKTIFNTEYSEFIKTFDKNLKSVFITSKAVCNLMKEKGCSIINISTIGSITPDISRICYVCSKAAINALTQNIALHAGKYNIRCNAILPGLIETDALKNNMPQQFIDLFLKNVPLNRSGQVNDIAKAVLFLASDDSSYITGQIIAVAGGFGNNNSPLYGFFNNK